MSVLSLENIEKSFGKRRVLDGVSLSIERGETLALIGPSGEGKSTLLRIVAMLDRADKGSIAYDGVYGCKNGHYADKAETAKCRQSLGMVFQSFELFPHRSVIQNICDAPVIVQHREADSVRQEGEALLARVGLAGREDAMPYQLSGGEKQRVCIARALCMHPKLLLFDEPTSALDPQSTKDVLNIIRSLKADGISMMIVTHEMAFAKSAADTVAFLRGGNIAAIGTSEKIFGANAPRELESFLTGGEG